MNNENELNIKNIDNIMHEVCKNMSSKNILEANFKYPDEHIISDNSIMVGSIFPNGRYEDTQEYKNVNPNAWNDLLELLKPNK